MVNESFARLLGIPFVALAVLHAQTVSPSGAPFRLGPDTPLEGQLAAGQTHEYRFDLKAGQYASLSVEQRTINLVATCLGPDGRELFAIDNYGIADEEVVELIAEVSGTYRIRLTPAEPNAPSGRYAIALRNPETAAGLHQERIAAARAFSRGMASYEKGTRDAMLQAIRYFEESLTRWKAAGDLSAQGRTLSMIGLTHIEVGNQQKALDAATQALAAAQAAHARRVEAEALNAIGEVHNSFGDRRRSIDFYERALSMLREVGDRAGEGNVSNNLAVAHAHTGEKTKALALFDRAEQIFRELQDRRMLAEVAGNAGVTYDNLGEYQRALESHQKALAIKRELADQAGQAIAWNNIATAYTGVAEYQKSLDAYSAALEINRALDNRRNVAINLNNIAWVYDQLGETGRALKFYLEALAIVRAVKDQRTQAVTLNNIADSYFDLGNYRKAIELHTEAIALRRVVGDTDGEANSLNNLGKTYAKLGDREKAREHSARALAILRSSGNRYMLARTLRNACALDRDAGNFQGARGCLEEALQISRSIRDRNGEAASLADLARLERDGGNFAAARQRAEEALAVLEALRLDVASPKLRASFFASAREIQELDIAALLRMHSERPAEGFDAAALLASERGRARSLLELLAESRREIRRGVDAALLARERALELVVAAKAERQTRLLSERHSESEAAAAEQELDGLTLQLEQVQARIRASSPSYAALTQPSPLSLAAIQSSVLDADTVLLEYALGESQSYLWAVTPSSVEIFGLPPRTEIESAVRRVYELLTARNRKLPNETAAARSLRIRQADEAFFVAANKASRILLGPAVSTIANKRLLIVGEGILQHLPFAALPDPDSEGTNAKPAPLILKHEIVTAPSASVITVLRRETAGRKPAEKALAVFADPVFSAGDPRVAQTRKPPALPAAGEAKRAAGEEFLRLRFSRLEADEITRLSPPGVTLKALDFDASRERVLSPDLGHYRIVHFATHSVLNRQHPELSGVVLSLVDPSGRSRNGFLRLYDIYNLKLDSELVVLSACQTGLGEEIQGEGLIGLTRGFLYAGAPRVVASLWEIDDRTTAEFMKRFYESMLGSGERPAAALRAAQAAMWRSRGWDAPYYWGAFTLLGEWR